MADAAVGHGLREAKTKQGGAVSPVLFFQHLLTFSCIQGFALRIFRLTGPLGKCYSRGCHECSKDLILHKDVAAVELPTLIVLLATYGALILGTTWLWGAAPILALILVTVAVAQFSSLQHEVLHGHPFRSRLLSEAAVFAGVTVYIPYIRFKDTHLAHHHDPILTDPYDDPESNFLEPAVWQRLSRTRRWLLRMNNTLLGRMIFGPAISTWSFVLADLQAIRAGNRHIRTAWLLHGSGVAMVLIWLWTVGQMPVWAYLIAAYLGFSLVKIRTFLEHRAHEAARARTVVIEDRGPLALLFLNNNFHSVHHMHPGTPWYQLPALYFGNKDHYLRRNEGYRYGSYAEIFRLFLLRPKDPVPHPLFRVNKGDAP